METVKIHSLENIPNVYQRRIAILRNIVLLKNSMNDYKVGQKLDTRFFDLQEAIKIQNKFLDVVNVVIRGIEQGSFLFGA